MTGNLPDQGARARAALLSRRNFLFGSAAAAGMGFYSMEVARHEMSVVSRALRIARLPEAFEGFRVVQISDIHFDEYTEPDFLRRMVDEVNRLAGDLVMITGDFVSYGPLPIGFAEGAAYRCAEVLRGLTCAQRYGIMGNHDTAVGVAAVSKAIEAAGVPILYDSYVPIERAGQRLWLCGTSDPCSTAPNLYAAVPEKPDGPVLLMAHAPDYADNVAFHPRGHLVDVMFAGHSHGGQVRFPLVGATILPPWGKKYVEGWFRVGEMQLYVNRGIGTVGLPLRLNCPPEVTVFTLETA